MLQKKSSMQDFLYTDIKRDVKTSLKNKKIAGTGFEPATPRV